MSYQTHNFQTGTKLYASELNEMDEQIKLLSEQETGGGAKTELIYNGTNISKSDGSVVNFADLVNLLKVSKDFVYLLYSDRAYLPTLIHDTVSGMKYIYFESTMIDSGHSKNAVIQVNSSNGTTIASIGTQSTVNENSGNKVDEITERNSNDENAYPSNKAVTGYVGTIKTDVANLKEDLEKITNKTTVHTEQGYVWTATADGAEWQEPQCGGDVRREEFEPVKSAVELIGGAFSDTLVNLMQPSVPGKFARNENGKIGFGTNSTYAYAKLPVEGGKVYSISVAQSGFSYFADENNNVIGSANDFKTSDAGYVYLTPQNAIYLYWTVQNNESWLSGYPDDVFIQSNRGINNPKWTATEYPYGELISFKMPKLIIDMPVIDKLPNILTDENFDYMANPNIKNSMNVFTNTGYVTTNSSSDSSNKYVFIDVGNVKTIKWYGRVNPQESGYKGIVYTDEQGAIIKRDYGNATALTDKYSFDSVVPENAKFAHFGIYKSAIQDTVITLGVLEGQILKNDNFNHVYYCGSGRDFKTLKSVIEEAEKFMDSTVYVDAETFDLVEEFGRSYLDSYNGSGGMIGLFLKNRIKIYFASGSKVLFNYTGTNENVHKYFSPFNSAEHGFTLVNATVESKNCRYSMHDERGSATDPYHNIYIGCNFVHDSSQCSWGTHQAIGGGLGKNGNVLIDGGIFINVGAEELKDTNDAYYSISYHNSSAENAKSKIEIKNAYMGTSALIMRGGNSTEKSYMLVSGCSVSRLPQAFNWNISPYNAECIEWGNIVRS